MAQTLKELDSLNAKIAEARHKRDDLDREARALARQRDELNEQFQKYKEETRSLKEKRNSLNLLVHELKEKREHARRKIVQTRTEIESTKKTIEDLKKSARGGYSTLKKRMDALEWKIQTTSLTIKEEARLMAQMKDLASKLEVHQKVRELADRIIMLQAELGANRLIALDSHEQLTKLAEESEAHHQHMMGIVKHASELKERADEIHAGFVDFRRKADAEHAEYLRAKELRDKIITEAQVERLKKEREVRKKIEESAEEKLKRKEKLSLDEFRTLIEKGAI